MIQPHCHRRDWIEAKAGELNAADSEILERSIFALSLLAALGRTKLDFVFKGGTALLLHLPTPRRLSIDIDIICAAKRDSLESALDGLVEATPFLRWEEHVRGAQRLPKRRHYKIYYDSPLRPGHESPILLDVVTEENHLVDIVEKPLEISFIETVEPVHIRTPSADALLGDKLTAFAPNTIGVPLTEGYSQQVIKQLFDIGQLYDIVTDPASVAAANRASYEAEFSYRESGPTYAEYLADVMATCNKLCALDLDGSTETDETQLLRRGLTQLPNHLMGCRFKVPQAKLAAAKTVALSAMLGRDKIADQLPAYDESQLDFVRGHEMPEAHRILQRLKKVSPETYFYWAKALAPS